jgi:hypothetical protein
MMCPPETPCFACKMPVGEVAIRIEVSPVVAPEHLCPACAEAGITVYSTVQAGLAKLGAFLKKRRDAKLALETQETP